MGAIMELEEKESAESDPQAAAGLIEEIARLQNTKNATMERIQLAVERVKELEKELKRILEDKEKAFKASLRKALPSVAEPLLERLSLDVCEVVEALSPFLAAHERATLFEMLNWLRTRTALIAKERSPEAWMFLGKPKPLYSENYSSWENFWVFGVDTLHNLLSTE